MPTRPSISPDLVVGGGATQQPDTCTHVTLGDAAESRDVRLGWPAGVPGAGVDASGRVRPALGAARRAERGRAAAAAQPARPFGQHRGRVLCLPVPPPGHPDAHGGSSTATRPATWLATSHAQGAAADVVGGNRNAALACRNRADAEESTGAPAHQTTAYQRTGAPAHQTTAYQRTGAPAHRDQFGGLVARLRAGRSRRRSANTAALARSRSRSSPASASSSR